MLERLAQVDEELAGLGRSEDQIESVLARFEDRDPEDLEAIDAQLAELAADVEGLESVLAEARERVASAPRVAPAAPAPGRPPASEPPVAEPEPQAEPEAAVADAVEDEEAETVEAPAASRRADALSAEDLFGEEGAFGEERPSSPDLAAMFADDDDEPKTVDALPEELGLGDSLADSLEGELEGIASAAARAEEAADGEPAEGPTNVFTTDDIEAIQDHARTSAPPPPAEVAADGPAGPSERPRRPSGYPRDPEIDALLGDDEQAFRPSQHPPSAEAADAEAADGDFELLVDEDILLVEDDDLEGDDFPEEITRVGEPAFLAEDAGAAQPTDAPPVAEEGTDEPEPGQKKGFFKKLFGGGD